MPSSCSWLPPVVTGLHSHHLNLKICRLYVGISKVSRRIIQNPSILLISEGGSNHHCCHSIPKCLAAHPNRCRPIHSRRRPPCSQRPNVNQNQLYWTVATILSILHLPTPIITIDEIPTIEKEIVVAAMSDIFGISTPRDLRI